GQGTGRRGRGLEREIPMTATQNECVAAYPRSQLCVDRVYARTLAWASYITALAIPATPDKAWVQQRVLAERTPSQATSIVMQTIPYLLEVPNTPSGIRDALNAYNDEATETGLATEIDNSLATVMPKYAAATITDYDVAMWCDRNDVPRP